jgi:hypothetical protein
MGDETNGQDQAQEKTPKKRATRKLELTPEMFEHAGQCALSWRHLAGIFGVDMSTIADRMKQPEFKEAFQRGRLQSENEVIQNLFSHMRAGNIKAAIFLAQAWCQLSTRHEVKHEGEVSTRYIVEVPTDAASLDEWSRTYAAPSMSDQEARKVERKSSLTRMN